MIDLSLENQQDQMSADSTLQPHLWTTEGFSPYSKLLYRPTETLLHNNININNLHILELLTE